MSTLTQLAKKHKHTTGNRKPATRNQKPATSSRKPVASVAVRVKRDYAGIAAMYSAGKHTWDEIADKFKIPRSTMNGISDRLAVGIKIDGKTVKIDRKRKAA